ncbi:methyltransferase [Altererythrobacter sp. Root672]|uniref:methyltransferase n=1 Tax=Altererythrobacter sp. Root672 TaxID=1736584 RepID=UPI0006FBA1F1|nr:methyltransferase [Altererythrobacter sp. Root672]KRA80452.1 methyltransferase [Altererythrobacter sp. Root672]
MASRDLETPPEVVKLLEIAWGYWASQVLRQTAEMGLADQFAAGPRDADELAGELGLHGPTFRRFLRTLTGMGILTEVAPRRYALTPMGEALKTGAPGFARSTIIGLIGKLVSPAWENLDYSLKTGEPGFEKHYGKGLFEHIMETPGLPSLFSEIMVGIHGTEPPAVAQAYDFSGIGSLVDVGGASGNMLGHILSRHEGVRGVLYDLPHVVADAPALLGKFGVADRVAVQGGSFFEGVPEGHDAYLMSHIIHDWDEQECATILGHCHRAMKPGGKVLIVEMVLPEGDEPHPGKLLDMMMLCAPGGRERTPSEYEALLAASGFRMTRVVPTPSSVSVVEAVRA